MEAVGVVVGVVVLVALVGFILRRVKNKSDGVAPSGGSGRKVKPK